MYASWSRYTAEEIVDVVLIKGEIRHNANADMLLPYLAVVWMTMGPIIYAAAEIHGAMGCDQKSFTLGWQ